MLDVKSYSFIGIGVSEMTSKLRFCCARFYPIALVSVLLAIKLSDYQQATQL